MDGGCPVGVLLPFPTGLVARKFVPCGGPGRCAGPLPLPREPRPRLGSPLNAV